VLFDSFKVIYKTSKVLYDSSEGAEIINKGFYIFIEEIYKIIKGV